VTGTRARAEKTAAERRKVPSPLEPRALGNAHEGFWNGLNPAGYITLVAGRVAARHGKRASALGSERNHSLKENAGVLE